MCALALVAARPAVAADWVLHTPNDFGGIGLIQNPTARMSPDGEFRIGLSTQYPYNNLYAGLQLFPWLETAVRYTEVRNRPYGTPDFSGDQTNKDRGVDLKLRLYDGGGTLPDVALGLRDVGGTGLFSSEYLVASQRLGDFDVTLGLGWGRLGTRGGIRNPFAALSDSFEDRPGEGTVDEETIGYDRWFSGSEIGVFGGVEWQTPLDALTVKLEYDGNDYQSEALSNPQEVDSPLNLGVNYRFARLFDVSVGLERGNTFMARLSLTSNWQNAFGPDKILDPPSTATVAALQPEPFRQLRAREALDPALYEALEQELERQSIDLLALDPDDASGTVTVWYRQALTRAEPQALARLGESLALMLPARYARFVMIRQQGDLELTRVAVLRDDVDRMLNYRIEPEDLRHRIALEELRTDRTAADTARYGSRDRYPAFSWSTGPALRQHVGGPDDFYFGQLWWRTRAAVALTPRWSVATAVGIDIYNNFDGLNYRDTSSLPHVRSDVVRYIKEGENNLVKLETNYVWSPFDDWYARLSGGIFEEMFGGVSGGLLYRRPYAPWAVGVDIARVRQRDYDQRFDFLDYEVTTGHLTGYFDVPWYDLKVIASVGRYLAGDVGSTLEVSREFANGIRAGVFATLTDVSAEEFGEGSFDKGFLLSIPLNTFFVKSSPGVTSFVFRPLTRDGGQKVRDGVSLYGLTERSRLDRENDWYRSMP